MMSTLTDAQRLEIVNEATSWIGTPWHHEARVKGVGVDCVMLLCEVYERVGLLPHVVPARYPQDIMLHKGQEVVLGYLDLYGAEVETPQLGDVVVYRFARSFSHAGIYAGERENRACLSARADGASDQRRRWRSRRSAATLLRNAWRLTMGGLFGRGNAQNATQPTIAQGIRVQSSVYGKAIPIVYGTNRLSGNLLWYGSFTAIPVASPQGGGGKGGGNASGGTQSYTYTAAVAIALCEGWSHQRYRIYLVQHEHTQRRCWSAVPAAQLGFSFFPGSYTQAPWSYLSTNFPSKR